MLKTLFLSGFLCIAATSTCLAKIWRVNNNTDVAADFRTLQEAYDGAGIGDTLYIEGSAAEYSWLVLRKKLIIIGPGYYQMENLSTQETPIPAKVSFFRFQDGSAGSVVMGLEFKGNIDIYENDIVIKQNKFIQSSGSNPESGSYSIYLNYKGNLGVNNVVISQNYGLSLGITYPASNILITNNYFTRSGSDQISSNCLDIHKDAEIVVQNNIFRRGKVTASTKTIFQNNIMYAGFFEGAGNLVVNNISNGNQFGTANGNQANVAMTSVFVGLTNSTYSDTQWKLKTGSPAIGAGFGSTPQSPIDAGIYGGEAPYVVSGLPPIPYIYFLETTPVGSNATPIKITVKAKSGG